MSNKIGKHFVAGNYSVANIVTLANTQTISGDKTFTGQAVFTQTIQGEALYAKWGDLAEMYETDQQYPVGTLLQFGGEKEMTIAHNYANAVVSSQPGLLINSEKGNPQNLQPIALIGKVPVRIIDKVRKFDMITLSKIDGVGTRAVLNDNIIGTALEDKTSSEEGLVLCSVKLVF